MFQISFLGRKLYRKRNLRFGEIFLNKLTIVLKLKSRVVLAVEKTSIIWWLFTDSSKLICGTVLYLYNLTERKSSYLLTKNRIVGKALEEKSIPSLEFEGIHLGVKTILDTFAELHDG